MTLKQLKAEICSLVTILEFDYKGIYGNIDPINNKLFYMLYNDKTHEANSIDEVMTLPFFDGKSLNEIAEILEF